VKRKLQIQNTHLSDYFVGSMTAFWHFYVLLFSIDTTLTLR